MAIDFTLSEAQQELQKNARAFAEGVLGPVAGRIDRAADGWESFLAGREADREMAHAGVTNSFNPAGYGGARFSMLDLAIAAEELTRVDVSVPTTLLATGLGLQPVIQYGTPEQKERFLRPFADDPRAICSPPTPSPTWPEGPTSIRPTRPAGCRPSRAATAASG